MLAKVIHFAGGRSKLLQTGSQSLNLHTAHPVPIFSSGPVDGLGGTAFFLGNSQDGTPAGPLKSLLGVPNPSKDDGGGHPALHIGFHPHAYLPQAPIEGPSPKRTSVCTKSMSGSKRTPSTPDNSLGSTDVSASINRDPGLGSLRPYYPARQTNPLPYTGTPQTPVEAQEAHLPWAAPLAHPFQDMEMSFEGADPSPTGWNLHCKFTTGPDRKSVV